MFVKSSLHLQLQIICNEVTHFLYNFYVVDARDVYTETEASPNLVMFRSFIVCQMLLNKTSTVKMC